MKLPDSAIKELEERLEEGYVCELRVLKTEDNEQPYLQIIALPMPLKESYAGIPILLSSDAETVAVRIDVATQKKPDWVRSFENSFQGEGGLWFIGLRVVAKDTIDKSSTHILPSS